MQAPDSTSTSSTSGPSALKSSPTDTAVADKPRQGKATRSAEKDDKQTTVFVGGLRKCTSEDKLAAHFQKYGQVDNVDIKRLPDGSSRGFAFVKFTEMG